MKRVLSLCLAMLLLAGCASKPSESGLGIDMPEFTAESLLAEGYGVDDCQSVTLGVLMEVQVAGGFSGTLGGTFEETPELAHMVIDAISSGQSMYYEIYIDRVADILYVLDENEWLMFDTAEFNSIWSDNFDDSMKAIESPQLRELEDGYEVLGYASSGVVLDIISFMFPEIDVSDMSVLTRFTYDIGRTLTDMNWEAENSTGRFVVDARVSKVNSTSITLPFKPEDLVTESEFDDYEWTVGCEDDEITLAEEYFGTDYVSSAEFLAGIDEKYRDMHEGVLFTVRHWYNSYSREGFMRLVATERPGIEEELMAAVLLCELVDIPVECLWENGYMSQDDVLNLQATLAEE